MCNSQNEKFFFFHFFSPLMYNHTTSSQLYYKYLQNLQRLHARYAKSANTTELNLRNIARKTLDRVNFRRKESIQSTQIG